VLKSTHGYSPIKAVLTGIVPYGILLVLSFLIAPEILRPIVGATHPLINYVEPISENLLGLV